MAYRIVLDESVAAAAKGLPATVREQLRAALEVAAQDPWALPRYHDRAFAEFRAFEWGEAGLAVVLIREPENCVVVLQITYAG